MKTVRCSSTIEKRGRELTCNRFLVEFDDHHLIFNCPNCGAKFVIFADKTGKVSINGYEKHPLFCKKKGE